MNLNLKICLNLQALTSEGFLQLFNFFPNSAPTLTLNLFLWIFLFHYKLFFYLVVVI